VAGLDRLSTGREFYGVSARAPAVDGGVPRLIVKKVIDVLRP